MNKKQSTQKVRICIANPAGNITIFVLDSFPRSQYQSVATELLSVKEFAAEQVAFVTGKNSMEMCGLEFCGNASRSFALMQAKKEGLSGHSVIDISVSGCNERLHVAVDTTNDYTKIKMPLPRKITEPDLDGIPRTDALCSLLKNSKIVDLDGIVHVIVQDQYPSMENFDVIKNYINEKFAPPAVGVMFYDSSENRLTPIVYVKDVNTTYIEGSCASGVTAVAAAFCQNETSGTFRFSLPQPAGTITATCEKANGILKAVYIEGPVGLQPVQTVDIRL
ncbi:hypothetical protein ACPW7J_11115 [Ihubacter sp. rT4E-8]|uniref:hypothetical protein n=1 Tax=unclassified Ihubacter TaxID=2633299 RepID=UPI003C7E67E1